MFLCEKDLIIMQRVAKQVDDKEYKELVKKFTADLKKDKKYVMNKINTMREKYPMYARAKSVQDRYYARRLDDVEYYIDREEIETAKTMLKRYIKENSWNEDRKSYFISTFSIKVREFYDVYVKED